MSSPLISVVFPTWNRFDSLRDTIKSILRELGGRHSHEIVIVDGGSTDGTLEYLATIPNVRMIPEDKPRGCCYAFDLGLRAARGEWVCWLNDDVEVLPGAFDRMLAFMTDPKNSDVGMGAFPSSRSREEPYKFVVRAAWDQPAVYADFGFLRRSLLEEIGYLDLRFKRFAWDPDLALRVWSRGLKVAPCPGAHIVHYFLEGSIRAKDDEIRRADSELMMNKWGGLHSSGKFYSLLEDESYCENLLQYLTGLARCKMLLYLGRTDNLAAEIDDLYNPEETGTIERGYAFGLELMRRRRFAEARPIFMRLAEHAPAVRPDMLPWYQCKAGESLLREGRPAEANPWLEKAALAGNILAGLLLAVQGETLSVAVGKPDAPAATPDEIVLPMNILDDFEWYYYFTNRRADRLRLYLTGPGLGADPRRQAYHIDAALAPAGTCVITPTPGIRASLNLAETIAEEMALRGFAIDRPEPGLIRASRAGEN